MTESSQSNACFKSVDRVRFLSIYWVAKVKLSLIEKNVIDHGDFRFIVG